MSAGRKEFSISFDDFDHHIRTSWQQLQSEPNFYDATLACENKQIQINKAIISCSSPVLKDIFIQCYDVKVSCFKA